MAFEAASLFVILSPSSSQKYFRGFGVLGLEEAVEPRALNRPHISQNKLLLFSIYFFKFSSLERLK